MPRFVRSLLIVSCALLFVANGPSSPFACLPQELFPAFYVATFDLGDYGYANPGVADFSDDDDDGGDDDGFDEDDLDAIGYVGAMIAPDAVDVALKKGFDGAYVDFGFDDDDFIDDESPGRLTMTQGKPFKGARLAVRPYKGKLQQSLVSSLTLAKKTPKDKRLAIQARKDGVAAFTQVPRSSAGEFDARITVAIDSTVGLVDGQSLAGFELQHPPGSDPLQFTSIVAAYSEDDAGDFQGFIVQAFNQDGPLGVAQLFTGSAQIDLRISSDTTDVTTFARNALVSNPLLGIGEPWTEISNGPQSLVDVEWTLGFGASNLDRKAQVYFDNLALNGPSLGPDLERELVGTALDGLLQLDCARLLVRQASPDVVGAGEALGACSAALDVLTEMVDEAVELDLLHPLTDGKLIARKLKGVTRGVDKIANVVATGKADKKPLRIAKPITRQIDNLAVVVSNLSGYRVTNPRKLPLVRPPLIQIEDDDDDGGGVGDFVACSTLPTPTGTEQVSWTLGGVATVGSRLRADTDVGGSGRFQLDFEDCDGDYLYLSFTFADQPSVGVFPINFFGGGAVTGFAKNVKGDGFGQLLSGGTFEVTAYDPEAELIEGTFSAPSVLGEGNELSGSFRVESFLP